MAEKSHQSRGLRARRGGWIGPEFARKIFLQLLDRALGKACCSPEYVHAIGRGVDDVRRRRQITPRVDRPEHPTAIVIDIDEHVADRTHRLPGPGTPFRQQGIDADKEVEMTGVHQA